MEKEPEYNLSFAEAQFELIENGRAIRGNYFVKGIYLKVVDDTVKQFFKDDKTGNTHSHEQRMYSILWRQKYRVLEVLTDDELSK